MENNKYVSYVGTYTLGKSKGIHIYDLDCEAGRMTERKEIDINNPSYLVISHNGRYLYSICDEGVTAYVIEKDGDLTFINTGSIKGMRGCHLSLSKDDHFLFVSGYHDGKVTVLELNEDGSVGKILDEVYHKGMGSIAERNFRPHINCAILTPDEKYLCVCDLGIDQVKVYHFDHKTGKLNLYEIIRCELESAPRYMMFSSNGTYAYIVCELKNYINVYEYKCTNGFGSFELIQTIPTVIKPENTTAAAAIDFSPDEEFLYCSNAGENSVATYKIDKNTGLLTLMTVLPISGDYPKDIHIFPDGKHLVSLNHESDSITFFTLDRERGLLVMNGAPLKIETPNCIAFKKLD